MKNEDFPVFKDFDLNLELIAKESLKNRIGIDEERDISKFNGALRSAAIAI